MKLFVLLLVAVSLTAIIADEEAEWAAFKQKFSKLFLSKGKEAVRKANFHKNHAHLKKLQAKHEAGEISYEPALYHFHDLDHDERLERMTGEIDEPETRAYEVVDITTRQTLPVNFTSVPILNAVKNQLACGSCWTFSAMCAVEGAYKKKYNTLVNLAEQQLVDCYYKNSDGTYSSGCNGGSGANAISWLSTNGAIATSNYAYTGVFGSCKQASLAKAVTKVSNVVQILNDTNTIKNAIMTYGSLAISVNASEWFNYGKGIFSGTSVVTTTNHAVNLVGWGTDSYLKQDYWLVRNSWGPTWGENGYIRLSTGIYSTYQTKKTYAAVIS